MPSFPIVTIIPRVCSYHTSVHLNEASIHDVYLPHLDEHWYDMGIPWELLLRLERMAPFIKESEQDMYYMSCSDSLIIVSITELPRSLGKSYNQTNFQIQLKIQVPSDYRRIFLQCCDIKPVGEVVVDIH